MSIRKLDYYLLLTIILIIVFQKAIEKIFFNGLNTPINELVAISTLAICTFTQMKKSKLKLSTLNASIILAFILFVFLSIVAGKNKDISVN